MPVTLTTLFCSPQDVWDMLSTEGVDLRLDDHNLSSGQVITTTADAVVGATTISVSALPVALLRGAMLEFDAAAMTNPVQVSLTGSASLGATSISVATLTTQVNSGAQARDSGVNAATGARLLVGCRKGTSEVKLFCNKRYDDSQLVLSGSVLDWATICAAKFLSSRRAQAVPKSIMADYQTVVERLTMVNVGQLDIEDIGTRGADWPTITNIVVDPTYNGMRARVQPNVSEGSPTAYGRYVDWNSAALLGY